MNGLRTAFESFFKRINSYAIKSTSAYGDVFIFALFLLVFTIARFLSILIHEFGHGIVALILGGDFFALYASPGTGHVYVYIENLSWTERVWVEFGGVLLQLIFGLVIFLVYPKIKNFLTKTFVLQLLVVLLVYPFIYLGLSVFYGGDGRLIVDDIRYFTQLDITIAFVGVNIFFAILTGYFVTRRVFAFLKDYFILFTKWERFYTLFLFFSLPLLIGFVGAILAISIIPLALIQFFIAFVIMINLVFLLEAYIVTRQAPEGRINAIKTKAVTGKETNTAIVSFVIIVVIWFAGFGPTPTTAHGVILKEPPLGAEKTFEDRIVANINVEFSPDEIEVELRLRAVKIQYSPLEYSMWKTYDSRAHWPYYENTSLFVGLKMFGTADWQFTSRYIGTEVFGYGMTYDHARVIRMSTTELDDSVTNSSGKYVLTLYDPWLKEPSPKRDYHVSMLNITCSSEFELTNYSTQQPRAPRTDFQTYLEWKNDDINTAPVLYIAEFSRI